jgi:hypothetical protein
MQSQNDPYAHLRALYRSLLERQETFDEFKYLLSLYPMVDDAVESESNDAMRVRAELNDRIRTWIGTEFEGLSATQVLQWRAIVVEERFNVSLSPWRESNSY